MNGHTTQLGPHEYKSYDKFDPKKEILIKFNESREHILILIILLFFSANIALAFIHYSSASTVIDSIPAPSSIAAVGEFLSF